MQIQDNLMDPSVISDPYTYFAEIRTNDPVHWSDDFGGWIVTRYEDVAFAFQDQTRFSAERVTPSRKASEKKKKELASTYNVLSHWMVFNDPPKHTRLRLLVNKAFTPSAVEKIKPRIVEISNELLDEMANNEKADIIKDYAYALPILVISEMLGLPKNDRDKIKKWSDDLMLLVFGAVDVPDRHEKAQKSLQEMYDYLHDIASKRRENPQDDLISAIAFAGDGGDKLTTDEIISTCSLLVFGGHETTTNLIANGMMSLLTHPQAYKELKDNPSLISSAVEEFLRYEGPSKAMIRIAKEDLELGGKKIKQNERLLLVQASANRDPAKFTKPDKLDITRHPNQHLGFGRGIHYCLGAPLARVEGEIAIKQLIQRFPQMTLEDVQIEWQPTIINRALKRLPVTLRGTSS
ncbi:cytochrome P450 [Alteribacillus sp. YIM 98480]|uniref:cytochrome P450 n=1 Tax=Alteribacillus sp. YIM 98480 TaxID=2606599 RepID=UPI00131D438C|nr:cytochrome P450 [Alteribacillus sp. YIM 98480]